MFHFHIQKKKPKILLKENNKAIGGIEIRDIDKRNSTSGGGIWINEDVYRTEAFCIRNIFFLMN